jgi:predicted CoA-binding protein
MSFDGQTDDAIRAILTETRRVAVVGASDKSWRPSYGVFRFLLAQGYDATPVNPLLRGRAIHGRTVVGSLAEAAPLEMVDIFRASANAGAAVDEAILLGARIVWMQLGVIDKAAAERARAAGLAVVMDRCPAIELPRLGIARA